MTTYKTEIKWGVIFTLVMLAWMVFERLMGWHGSNIEQHASMTNLFAVPAVAVYLVALMDKRNNDLNGSISWKEGFICGVIITLVATVLSPIAQVLIHTVISPEYFDNMIAYAVSEDLLSQQDAEATFNLGSYITISLLGTPIMGILTSAVVALVTKKD